MKRKQAVYILETALFLNYRGRFKESDEVLRRLIQATVKETTE